MGAGRYGAASQRPVPAGTMRYQWSLTLHNIPRVAWKRGNGWYHCLEGWYHFRDESLKSCGEPWSHPVPPRWACGGAPWLYPCLRWACGPPWLHRLRGSSLVKTTSRLQKRLQSRYVSRLQRNFPRKFVKKRPSESKVRQI